jgi:phage terminase Nu1 subunit (DNA packaging protein)
MTKTMNKGELARAFGVSTTAIDNWLSRGCPFEAAPDRPGKAYRFSLPAVVQWRTERLTETAATAGDCDLNEAKRRRAVAEAELAEIDLAERRRDLLPRSDVDAAVIGAFARVRARLLAVPTKVAAEAAATTEPATVERLLDSAVHEALAELASTDVEALCRDAA